MFNDEQIDKLRYTLSTDGWVGIMEPTLGQRGRSALKALVLTQDQRTGEYAGESGDVIRGRIKEIEWTLLAWQQQINNHEANRRLDEARNGSGTTSEPNLAER